MSGVSLAVVIPTRNRTELASNAIRYLLQQPGCDLQVFVSDNSAHEEEVRRLAGFCRELNDPRVTYMRTSGDLPQGAHWDWATREALRRSNATHVTLHYDRKVFRPGSASFLLEAASRFPDKVITYLTDVIAGEPPPLRLWQAVWSGKLYAVKTARTLELSARGQTYESGHALPILSNCIVPRAVIESIASRFGNLCVSTTADSCFAFRFCALHDDYLHLDRSLAILYGSHRSAGIGYLTGEPGGDFEDYRRTWRGDSWLDAAPIPGLNLGFNMHFHEYELVRRSAIGKRLPPLDRAGYLRDLGRGLQWIRNERLKAELRRTLEEHGWTGDLPAVTAGPGRLPFLRRASAALRQRAALFLATHFRVQPRSSSGFEFDSDEQALHHALRFPRWRTRTAGHLKIVEAVAVETPAS